MTSDRLEYLIDCQRRQMEQAETELERRYAWAWMRVLISQRTPEQVAKMEAARGLR